MKILVTGGSGFIGSHLTELLLAQGHEVVTLDDFSTGRQDFLQLVAGHDRHTLVEGSVTDRKVLAAAMNGCDAVFHLAAVLGVKNTVENPLKVIEGNIDGTRHVLELAYERQAKVTFASTSEIYGKNQDLPFREDESNRVLGAPCIHHWCYATAKALDEHMCYAYADKGLPMSIVRFFNAYGPRQSSSQYGGVVSRFIKAALRQEPLEVYGDGNQTRCFTYVGDAVRGTMATLRKEANGLAFNIGSDRPISINDLAAEIKRVTGSSSPIVRRSYEEIHGPGFEDTPARLPDLTRSHQVLGYRPNVLLAEGLTRTAEWFRTQEGSGV
ncbi:MAG TPA: NAD-dependent epimerase/dehydratase family protein [Bacilli bacterium]|nr:NAD-dependent epimerase/dehydratase family protein [Bacilli bacterium]